ncbi:hypothetical protein LTR62_003493 [Meristemomyces frigidus]|uniref:alpha-galactosidase n=1 Tax=Meristemomyces frigidus TaxID=1508187 RepID=A0AAN7YGW9_9PEZI|nr:hypothetical protein LTR62_003493 [Meristemomyces frigidus]
MPGGWSDLDMLEVGLGGMTDGEYVAHFSMWAALKSPLLLGNDIRKLDAKTLSIINNPAIIAISQDPLRKAVQRIALNTSVPVDSFGIGETHIWSGALANGDQIVIFLNAADTALYMQTTLAEIFVMDGPHGSAPQAKQTWDVHDLWQHGHSRMKLGDAQALLDAESQESRHAVFERLDWFNASTTSYADALAANDERLFGYKVGEVKAGRQSEFSCPTTCGEGLQAEE